MILMHMTKQGLPTSEYLTALQAALARTIYLKWLRNAHDVLRGKSPVPLRTSPRKPSKLFRAACIAADDVGFDEVTDEVARWEALKSNEIECFRTRMCLPRHDIGAAMAGYNPDSRIVGWISLFVGRPLFFGPIPALRSQNGNAIF